MSGFLMGVGGLCSEGLNRGHNGIDLWRINSYHRTRMQFYGSVLRRYLKPDEVRCKVNGCLFPELPNGQHLCLGHSQAAKRILSSMTTSDARIAAKNGLHFVYFVQAEENGPIKIGRTSTLPEKRLSSLQTSTYVELKLLAYLPAEGWLEKSLHRALYKHRKSGEWFDYCPEVMMIVAMAKDGLFEKIHEYAKKYGGLPPEKKVVKHTMLKQRMAFMRD